VLIEFVGEALQSVRDGAEGGDGFATDFGDDGGIDVGGGMADFHLDEFDGLFEALADAAWIWAAGRRWGITGHGKYLYWALAEGPFLVWADGKVASTGEARDGRVVFHSGN